MNLSRPSAFRRYEEASAADEVARKPPHVVLLPASAFHDKWPDRPKDGAPVAVGLITISSKLAEDAGTRASAMAIAAHPHASDLQKRLEMYVDVLVRSVVAWTTCSPEDINVEWLEAAEDNLPLALTPEAIRHLFDEQRRVQQRVDPTRRPILDEQLHELVDFILSGALARLDPVRQTDCRKDLTYLLDAFRSLPPLP